LPPLEVEQRHQQVQSDLTKVLANYPTVFLVPRRHDLASLDRPKDSPDLFAKLNSSNHLSFLVSAAKTHPWPYCLFRILQNSYFGAVIQDS